MTEPTFSDVWAVLELNPQFLGAYGKMGEPCLTKDEKNLICGIVVKKLKASLKNNGQDFFSEFWPHYKRSLAVQDWFARYPAGELIPHYILLAVIYRKCSTIALNAIKKRQPKTIIELIPQVVQENFG